MKQKLWMEPWMKEFMEVIDSQPNKKEAYELVYYILTGKKQGSYLPAYLKLLGRKRVKILFEAFAKEQGIELFDVKE